MLERLIKAKAAHPDDAGIDALIWLVENQGKETTEQQLERQIAEKGLVNNFGKYVGVLAEEGVTWEDDLKLLTK